MTRETRKQTDKETQHRPIDFLIDNFNDPVKVDRRTEKNPFFSLICSENNQKNEKAKIKANEK